MNPMAADARARSDASWCALLHVPSVYRR